MRGCTKGSAEATREGAWTHHRSGCHLLHREIFMQMGCHPCENCAEWFALIGCREKGCFDVLGLTTIAMQRNYHAPGYGCCDLGTVVLADHVEREINRGSSSGRGQHLAFIDV